MGRRRLRIVRSQRRIRVVRIGERKVDLADSRLAGRLPQKSILGLDEARTRVGGEDSNPIRRVCFGGRLPKSRCKNLNLFVQIIRQLERHGIFRSETIDVGWLYPELDHAGSGVASAKQDEKAEDAGARSSSGVGSHPGRVSEIVSHGRGGWGGRNQVRNRPQESGSRCGAGRPQRPPD